MQLFLEWLLCFFAAIGAIGVADVLIFTGRIGVLFGKKWNSLIGREDQ